MHQWLFDGGLRLNQLIYDVFFPLIYKVSLIINSHEYKNKIICIFDNVFKVLQSLLPFIKL